MTTNDKTPSGRPVKIDKGLLRRTLETNPTQTNPCFEVHCISSFKEDGKVAKTAISDKSTQKTKNERLQNFLKHFQHRWLRQNPYIRRKVYPLRQP